MTINKRNIKYEDFVRENPHFIESKVKMFCFSKGYIHLYDILLSEAQIIVLNSIETYDNEQGTLKGWISINILNGLRKFMNSYNEYNNTSLYEIHDVDNSKVHIDSDSCLEFLIYFDKFSKVEQFIIVSYFFENETITYISKLLGLPRYKINNVVDSYSEFMKCVRTHTTSNFELLAKGSINEL